jgi:hypothetical protein
MCTKMSPWVGKAMDRRPAKWGEAIEIDKEAA